MGSFYKLEATVKEGYSSFYVINVVFQSIFTLLWQIGTAVLIAWLCVNFLDAPLWIYVPLIFCGVITGLISMIRFILTAMRSLESLEAARREKQKARGKTNEK
jgi:hypothetical protein